MRIKKKQFDCKVLADNGVMHAMVNYYSILYHGKGIKANKKEAVRYLKNVCDKGNALAMKKYALMMYKNDDTSKEEIARCLKMSADKGIEESILYYALFLLKGNAKNKDRKEAA